MIIPIDLPVFALTSVLSMLCMPYTIYYPVVCITGIYLFPFDYIGHGYIEKNERGVFVSSFNEVLVKHSLYIQLALSLVFINYEFRVDDSMFYSVIMPSVYHTIMFQWILMSYWRVNSQMGSLLISAIYSLGIYYTTHDPGFTFVSFFHCVLDNITSTSTPVLYIIAQTLFYRTIIYFIYRIIV